MVHNMDAFSARWKHDPVRAALEKKANREAAADRMAKVNALAGEILQKKIADASSSSKSALEAAEEEGGAGMSDADYRKLLERQRDKLMGDGHSDSSSSNISVFDPFQSK